MGDGSVQRVDGVVGGHNIQIGSAGGDITVVLDQPGYRLELLIASAPPRRLPRSQRLPSHLLDAQRQVVPYRERPAEQAVLAAWRDDDEPFSVRLVHGPGGAGKTRLASRLATDAHRAGWVVVQAADKSAPLREATRIGQIPAETRLLVVVDYAERWPLEGLTHLVEALASRQRRAQREARDQDGESEPGRVRVLLLARPQTGFWEGTAAELERADVDLATPIGLGDFTTGADWEEAFTQAAHAFQDALEIPRTTVPAPEGFGDNADGSPLTLHMAALAAVCAADDETEMPGRDDLSAFLLRHERRYWRATAAGEEVIGTAVLIAILFGPELTAAQARSRLQTARLADGEAQAERLLDIYDRLYPATLISPTRAVAAGVTASSPGGDGQAVGSLAPLKPDRFAEDFIAEQLNRPRVPELVTDLITSDKSTGSAVRQALIVLAAAARHPTVRSVLFPLLESHPQLLTHVSPALIEAVTRYATPAIAAMVHEKLPRFSTELLRPARDLARHLLDTLPADTPPSRRADRLNDLGVRLSEAGDRRAALEPTQEATGIYRRLAEAEPGAYLPDLASSLNNLGIRLSEIGQKRTALEAAREATGIYRRLAEAQPGAYLPDLARSLDNLGGRLAEAGEKRAALEPAQEAVAIRRRLAEAEPGVYLSDLAMSLNNLGIFLSEIGQKRAALEATQEATGIYRQLAEAEPAVYLPDLASSLRNLGGRQSEVGDRWAALEPTQEALAIDRRLAEAEPAVYLPNLARSLNNLGIFLSEVGDRRAALEPAQEATGIYRRLAEAEPGAYLPDLAMSLNNLGIRLSEIGQKRTALEAAREATGIYRRLAEAQPGAYLPDLARSLNNLGSRLAETGDRRAALEPAQEATGIYRRLAEAEPGAYLPNLASALSNLGGRLAAVEDNRALEPTREATGIYRRLAETEPAAYLPTLAISLSNLGIFLAAVGDRRAAREPTQEATDINRRLAEAEPAAYLPALAMSLYGYAWARAENELDLPSALAAAREAVEIYQRLARQLPEAFNGHLAAAQQIRASLEELNDSSPR